MIALRKSSQLVGILNGAFWAGIFGGSGGSCVGVGSRGRGLSRSGSSDLRYVVYTFGSSEMLLKGRSRLL
jgi:hypothetical protein